ncbi:MAG: phosphotransferase [Nitrospiraceae bacterium]|nr:phosphotransferase [Nitrospiraceae bacterium]
MSDGLLDRSAGARRAAEYRPLQGDLIATADGQLGLIVYTFAGGNLHTGATSFYAFFHSQGGQAAAKVFDQLFGIYGRQWWASNELRRIVFAEEYDRLLPVQLTLRTIDPATNPTLIQAGQTNSLTLRHLRPGQPVQLVGLRVIKQQAERLTLYAAPPAGERSAPLRIRLQDPAAAAYQPGDLLPPHAAVIESTRWESLVASAQAAISSFDTSAEHFVVEGVSYRNPLLRLTATLDLAQDVRVSIVHGDLNLQNILVEPASSFAWLIDFAETHRGPTLLDLQRMEVQVLAKLLGRLPRPTQGAGLVASLLDALHTTTPTLASPVPALQEPYTLLVTLREWARQFLVDDRQWDEYYRGLLLALIGALKFDELDNAARALVLVGAAKASELIGKPLATPVDPAPGQPPYKGLQAFDVADADLFFGREQLINDILAHLQQEPFLAIVGPSGSGKSSLVRAGLSAALVNQATDPATWAVTILTPTAQPLPT